MKIMKFLALPVVALVLFACEPTYEKQLSWAYPIAGDWVVNVNVDGEHYTGPLELKSYNTATGQDSIWFDDFGTGIAKASEYGTFWTMKYKVAVNMSNLTFKADSTLNKIPGYDIMIYVTDGKIINKDSIYFKIEFADDLGTIYEVLGHRSTSYDDYMGNH